MKKLSLFICFYLLIAANVQGEPPCYRQLAIHFFDDSKAIMQAMGMHRITESSWTPIIQDLRKQSKGVYALVQKRSRLLENNPLAPFDPAAAEKLLSDTLLEIFQRVMNSYLITNQGDIIDMFTYIQRHQKEWRSCFAPN